VDRAIDFGQGAASSAREATERGRLLGFTVATMFTEDSAPDRSPVETQRDPATMTNAGPSRQPRREPTQRRRLEFAGVVSSGFRGTSAGLGAMAGLRLAWTGPLWARVFVSGRAGSIPEAQATTRTGLAGVGASIAALPPTSAFVLGARLDVFASYFEAAHLSEDDVAPDRRHRWLVGGDVVAEAGFQLAGSMGLFSGIGLEAVPGKTEVYTHGNWVATVPPLRVVAELGLRAGF
jgi:hypothetical protein